MLGDGIGYGWLHSRDTCCPIHSIPLPFAVAVALQGLLAVAANCAPQARSAALPCAAWVLCTSRSGTYLHHLPALPAPTTPLSQVDSLSWVAGSAILASSKLLSGGEEDCIAPLCMLTWQGEEPTQGTLLLSGARRLLQVAWKLQRAVRPLHRCLQALHMCTGTGCCLGTLINTRQPACLGLLPA